ncbi:MAG: hypothetical protein IJ190_02970 [Prevotella sp.]|nr:hypothetical protein [Prevotella sp.]
MDQRTKQVLAGKICPYCGKPTELTDSAEVYHGYSFGLIYLCRSCDAYVGCHKGTERALGRLANAELRYWKHQAHEAFDKLWQGKTKVMTREQGYRFLSRELGIPAKYTHIGMFKVETCQKVISICNKVLSDHEKTDYGIK